MTLTDESFSFLTVSELVCFFDLFVLPFDSFSFLIPHWSFEHVLRSQSIKFYFYRLIDLSVIAVMVWVSKNNKKRELNGGGTK